MYSEGEDYLLTQALFGSGEFELSAYPSLHPSRSHLTVLSFSLQCKHLSPQPATNVTALAALQWKNENICYVSRYLFVAYTLTTECDADYEQDGYTTSLTGMTLEWPWKKEAVLTWRRTDRNSENEITWPAFYWRTTYLRNHYILTVTVLSVLAVI